MVPCPPALPGGSLDGDSSHVCSPDASELNDLDDDIPSSDGSDLAKQQRTLSRMKVRRLSPTRNCPLGDDGGFRAQ